MMNIKFPDVVFLVTLSLKAGAAQAEIRPEEAWAHIVSRAQASDLSLIHI